MADLLAARVAAVRRFSRFYSRRVGLLHEGLLGSPYSLTEARVIYELAQRDPVTATELGRDLGLDLGYLSRILRGFARARLIKTRVSPRDGRASLIALSPKGRAAFAKLNAQSRREITDLLRPLGQAEQARAVGAMATIEALLAERPRKAADFTLRPHRPGDMGWVIGRHGAIYASEFGWDISFEALVAEIAAGFIKNFDPEWENCWIAERDGVTVGSVFVVRQSATVAKLRMLIVDPAARGLGLGETLVNEVIAFARAKRYRKLSLWTHDVLGAARKLYQRAGFKVVHSAPHHSFGKDLVEEIWELKL